MVILSLKLIRFLKFGGQLGLYWSKWANKGKNKIRYEIIKTNYKKLKYGVKIVYLINNNPFWAKLLSMRRN